MAIYSLAEWQIVPGKIEEVLKLEQAYLSYIQSIGGKPIGGFTTAVGNANRLVALIAYDSFDQYGKAVQAAQQNPQFQQLVDASSGMFTDITTSLLMPTPNSQLQ